MVVVGIVTMFQDTASVTNPPTIPQDLVSSDPPLEENISPVPPNTIIVPEITPQGETIVQGSSISPGSSIPNSAEVSPESNVIDDTAPSSSTNTSAATN